MITILEMNQVINECKKFRKSGQVVIKIWCGDLGTNVQGL
jgi:hypothetical protein